MTLATTEPIVRCSFCGGQGILPGPRVCALCNGEGLRALEAADTIPAPPATEPKAVCSCGATYDAGAYEALRLVGYQDDGEGGWLDLRNCTAFNPVRGTTCGSTMAVVVPRLGRSS